jgi:hypothetical protein
MAVFYCIPLENGLRTETYSGSNHEEKKDCCVDGIMRTLWPESARELYRPSECRLSAMLVPNFADKAVSRSQRGGSLMALSSFF